MRALGAEERSSGYRAFVSVAGEDGLSRGDLAAEDFAIQLDDGDPIAPRSVLRLGEADEEDLDAELSIVVDDSGSISDCDARFVGQGLSHLFDVTPPVYSAQLLKFDTALLEAAARTSDVEVLGHAATELCTSRGGTAMWDAMLRGLEDLPETGDFRALLLFTDGLDNASLASRRDIVELAEERRIAIFVVALGLADVLSLSRIYADGARGGMVYVPSGERVLRGFEQLTSFVNDAYMLEWDGEAGASRATITVGDHSDGIDLD